MAHQHWLEQSSLDVVVDVSSFEILPDSPEPLEHLRDSNDKIPDILYDILLKYNG